MIGIFRVFGEGDDLYEAMIDSIRAASQRIVLASYILAGDEVGWALLNELMNQARRGLDVRIHIDAMGSGRVLTRSQSRLLRAAGVRLKRFHRWSWRQPMRYNRRDHRKLLVIDGETAYLGGFNIHREASRRVYGETRWRDLHVYITGPLAAEAEGLFNAFWCGLTDWSPRRQPGSNDRIIPNTTRACRILLRCTIKAQLARASESIWLESPYFIPDRGLRKQLILAAERGVDVRILTTRKTDSPPAQWAARGIYGDLLANGIRIFEFQPRLLHSKLLLIDEDWANIGTANFDYRSMFLNYEVTLVSGNRTLNRQLKSEVLRDLQDCHEVIGEAWRDRAAINYLYDMLGRLLRRWL
ncbi:MAG: phosphatidylserine/phosphatidylglycerophosphate/cardiolipin synthase family protein [Marinobacter sp.]|nr:phosphatidylserine/phosphatidylglycerophosphate/cardiolipin synthase family protein [Marinobacter sp.]